MPRFRMWLPALLWAALILTASSDSFSMQQTGGWLRSVFGQDVPWGVHVVVRKTAHVVEYGILSFLVVRAAAETWTGRTTAWMTTVVICLAVACADELNQSRSRNRRGAAGDVALDTVSAATVSAAAIHMRRRRRTPGAPGGV